MKSKKTTTATTTIKMTTLLLLLVGNSGVTSSRGAAVAAAKQQRNNAFVGAAAGSAATGFINHNSRRRRRRRRLLSSFPSSGIHFSTTASTTRRRCYYFSSSSSSSLSTSGYDGSSATVSSSSTEGTRAVSETERSSTTRRPIRRRYLVVGDGDLSYSASIASELAEDNIQLIATVLENQEIHHHTYANSRECTSSILEQATAADDEATGDDDAQFHHQVRFGIDATRLENYFNDEESFDRIVFNFPHWSGKSNNKYNRLLVDKFLKSASKVLLRGSGNEGDNNGDIGSSGEIHVALCEGQGGYDSATKSVIDYRQSWKVAELAANHGLMLLRTQPFFDSNKYNLSSYREKDQPFRIGQDPLRYVFGFPTNDIAVDTNLQVSCRHELRIVLPNEPKPEEEDFGDAETIEVAVMKLAKDVAPSGIRVEIPIRNVITIDGGTGPQNLLVFLMVYSGECIPLTRDLADTIRSNIETAVLEKLKFDIAKRDRMVSTPFPYHLLSIILHDYSP